MLKHREGMVMPIYIVPATEEAETGRLLELRHLRPA
jgi:hypothetical protein